MIYKILATKKRRKHHAKDLKKINAHERFILAQSNPAQYKQIKESFQNQTIDISHPTLSPSILDLISLTKHANLSNCDPLTYKELQQLKNLESINFNNCYITDTLFYNKKTITQHKQTKLTLIRCKPTDKTLFYILKEQTTKELLGIEYNVTKIERHKNNTLKSKSNWKNDRRHSITEWYHDNTTLEYHTLWKDGVQIKSVLPPHDHRLRKRESETKL